MADDLHPDHAKAITLLARYKTRYKELKARHETLHAEHEQLIGATEELVGERDELTGRLSAAPDEVAAENARLKGEIRDGKHRAAFEKAARAAGIPDTHLDDLYKVSGYAPEGDEPDAATLSAFVAQQVQARPYFLPAKAGPAAEATATETPATPDQLAKPITIARPGGPGLGRGAAEGGPVPEAGAGAVTRAVDAAFSRTGRSVADGFRL